MKHSLPTFAELPRVRRNNGRWRVGLSLLGCVSIIGSSVLLSGGAAAAAVSNPSVTVLSDGTAPFDLDDEPGRDSGANNGILRAQDTAVWEVRFTGETDTTADFVATLPAGMRWNASSVAAAVCNGQGGGSISADALTLRCERIIRAGETTAFPLSAVAGAVANGAQVAPEVRLDGRVIPGPPSITVSAAPRTGLAVRNGAQLAGTELNGQRGVNTTLNFFLGAEVDPANPAFFGYEAIDSPVLFDLDVPQGTVVSSANTQILTTSQDSPGATVGVTLNAHSATLDFLRPAANGFAGGLASSELAADARVIAAYELTLFTPYEGTIAVGETVTLGGQIHGFDPVSISGQSNFGAGYAPGHAPGTICPALPSNDANASCYGKRFTRSARPVLNAGYSTTSAPGATGNLYADDHPYTSGNEAVLIGQQYNVQTNVFNAAAAEEPLSGAYASLSWDPTQQHLTDVPQALLNPGVNGFVGYTAIQLSEPLLPEQLHIEYTDYVFASDAERKTLASFESAAPRWVTDPAQLSGGLASVSSVRVRMLDQIEPNSTVGFVFPMQRSDTSSQLAVGTNLPWFWQYGATDTPLVKSRYAGSGATVTGLGGNVQVAEGLVRADLTVEPVDGAAYPAGQAERGDLVDLNISPVVIGPLSGPDASIRDAELRLTMPSACVTPLATALPPGAVLAPGAGGGDCNTAAPAVLTIPLGTLAAPAGPAGGDGYPARATHMPGLRIPLVIGADLVVPSQLTVRLAVSSPSDPTAENHSVNPFSSTVSRGQDRTQTAGLQVSNAAALKTSGINRTKVHGAVEPVETVTHSLLWSNTSTTTYQQGSFVSVLPFDGDNRGTTGLGSEGVQLAGVGASSLSDPAVPVAIEYTLDSGPDVVAALNRPGNSGGASGIIWLALEGALPKNVSAFRFAPQGALLPGSLATVSIAYRVPTLEHAGVLGNDVSFAVRAGNDELSQRHAASSLLDSSSALLAGTVFRAEAGAEPQPWEAQADAIELIDDDGVAAIGAIADDGQFVFPAVQPGTYSLRMSAAAGVGWQEVTPTLVTLGAAESVTDARLLLQRTVLDPSEGFDDNTSKPDSAPSAVTGTTKHRLVIPQDGSATFARTPSGADTAPTVLAQPARGRVNLSPDTVGFDAQGIAPGEYTFQLDAGAATDLYTVVVQPRPTGDDLTVTIDEDADGITFDPIGQTSGVNLQPLTAGSFVAGIGSASQSRNGFSGNDPRTSEQAGREQIERARDLSEGETIASSGSSLPGDRVVYRPAAGFTGVDSLTVDVVDDLGQRLTLTYSIAVLPAGQSHAAAQGGGGLSDVNATSGAVTSGVVTAGAAVQDLAETGQDASLVAQLAASAISALGCALIILRRPRGPLRIRR